MEADKDQKIQEYLDGSMSQDEKLAFEGLMNTDAELAAEVTELRELEYDLKAAGVDSFRSKMDQWEQGYQKNQGKNRMRTFLAIAASIVVVLLAGYYFTGQQGSSAEKLYAANFVPYEDMILTRGEPSATGSQLVDGMIAYNDGDYTIAAEHLEQFRITNPDNKAAALYLAISQTELGRYDAAERSFNIAMEDPNFRQQAQWYLSLMYIKNHKNAEALGQLQAIADNTDHYKSAAATELMQQIDLLK